LRKMGDSFYCWGLGYQGATGEDQEVKDKAALRGRQGLPDHVLKVQTGQGYKYAKQRLQERWIFISILYGVLPVQRPPLL